MAEIIYECCIRKPTRPKRVCAPIKKTLGSQANFQQKEEKVVIDNKAKTSDKQNQSTDVPMKKRNDTLVTSLDKKIITLNDSIKSNKQTPCTSFDMTIQNCEQNRTEYLQPKKRARKDDGNNPEDSCKKPRLIKPNDQNSRRTVILI